MTAVEKIQTDIQQLLPSERLALRAWLIEFEDDAWDLQMGADSAAGKFEKWMAMGLSEIRAGRHRAL